jgi:ketosteroid isomerase-like protein
VNVREALDGLFAAWRRGDALRAVAYFAPDGAYREAGREAILGREAMTEHFTRFFRDGPPWHFVVDDVVVEGDRAAVSYRFEVEGDDGSWRAQPGCAFVTFTGGAIAEWREYEG